MCRSSLRHGTMIETNGRTVAVMSGHPCQELAQPLHPLAHRRPRVAPIPRLAPGAGRLPPHHLPHSLATSGLRCGEAGRAAAVAVEEALTATAHTTPY